MNLVMKPFLFRWLTMPLNTPANSPIAVLEAHKLCKSFLSSYGFLNETCTKFETACNEVITGLMKCVMKVYRDMVVKSHIF